MCNRVWKQIEKSQFVNRGNCRCVPAPPFEVFDPVPVYSVQYMYSTELVLYDRFSDLRTESVPVYKCPCTIYLFVARLAPRCLFTGYRYKNTVQYGNRGKKTPGGAGTHTGHTGHPGARGHTDHTDEPHNHPPKPNDTYMYPHENRDRLNSRKNSHKPGVDRSPRPTQKRPPPANPTLPPPAPRAPPRAYGTGTRYRYSTVPVPVLLYRYTQGSPNGAAWCTQRCRRTDSLR